jgi:hypothetical protein
MNPTDGRMNPTDEVDDLLAKAGAQWRAGQPSAPEPDLGRITAAGADRRFRRWVPAVAGSTDCRVGLSWIKARLRRGPHDSGMTGRKWPAVSEWGRGASSRLPLSPVRTYQEQPEGAPPWPLWRLLIALRVG